MAGQSSTRKPWRKTRWALFVIFLVLLGAFVHHLPSRPEPRVAMRGDWLEFTALSSDGRTLVTSQGDQNVSVWDTRSGRKVQSFPYRMRTVSADGRLLAMSDDAGTVIVADLQTGRRQTLGKPVPGRLVFSPTTKLLLVVGGEPEYKHALFETDTGKLIGIVKAAGDDDCYQFTPEDKHVAWGGLANDDLRLWDAATGKLERPLKGFVPFKFAPDRRTVLGVYHDRYVFWDMIDRGNMRPLRAPTDLFLWDASFSPDSKTLLCLNWEALKSEKEGVFLWDVATGKSRNLKLSPEPDKGNHWFNPFSPDSRLFFFWTQGKVAVCEAESGRVLWTTPFRTRLLFFTQDSRFLVATRDPNWDTTDLLDAKTGHVTTTPGRFSNHGRFSIQLNYCPPRSGILEWLRGWLFQAEDPPSYVRVFEGSTGSEIACVEIPHDGIEPSGNDARVSDDGSTLVTISHNDQGSLECWDLPIRKPLLRTFGVPLAIACLLFLVTGWRHWRRCKSSIASGGTKV